MPPDLHIIDNILSDTDLKKLQYLWSQPIYRPVAHTAYAEGQQSIYDSQFVRVLYNQNFDIVDRYLHVWDPLYERLGVESIHLARMNITLPRREGEERISGYHIDMEGEKDILTCLYYLNSNNGGTIFEESGQFIQSVENRAVIFRNGLRHSAVFCTDSMFRFVYNLNYRPSPNHIILGGSYVDTVEAN